LLVTVLVDHDFGFLVKGLFLKAEWPCYYIIGMCADTVHTTNPVTVFRRYSRSSLLLKHPPLSLCHQNQGAVKIEGPKLLIEKAVLSQSDVSTERLTCLG